MRKLLLPLLVLASIATVLVPTSGVAAHDGSHDPLGAEAVTVVTYGSDVNTAELRYSRAEDAVWVRLKNTLAENHFALIVGYHSVEATGADRGDFRAVSTSFVGTDWSQFIHASEHEAFRLCWNDDAFSTTGFDFCTPPILLPNEAPSFPDLVSRADSDGDGIPDNREEELLQRYAPRVQLHRNEQFFPTSVDDFLANSSLRFSHNNCVDDLVANAPAAFELPNFSHTSRSGLPTCAEGPLWESGRDVSSGQDGFFLDVSDSAWRGSPDPSNWVLYGHVTPRGFSTGETDGIEIQYWQLYAFNESTGGPLLAHEGDWEFTGVTLNDRGEVEHVTYYRHGNVRIVEPHNVIWDGDHHTTFSSRGGHAQYPHEFTNFCANQDRKPAPISEIQQALFDAGDDCGIRWDTWTTGEIVNVGEFARPAPGQDWLRYSGRFGSVGEGAAVGIPWTSGPLGPAYQGPEVWSILR